MAKIFNDRPNYLRQGLHSILDMDNLFEGGIKTEYGLYAMSAIVKSGGSMYAPEALGILEDLSEIDFRTLNNDKSSEEIIMGAMWNVADEIAQREPKFTPLCYQIVKQAEQNSNCEPDEDFYYRKKFFENHKEYKLIEAFNKDDYNPWSPWRSQAEHIEDTSAYSLICEGISVETEALLCQEMLKNMEDMHKRPNEHEWRFNQPALVAKQIELLKFMMSQTKLKGQSDTYSCPEEKRVIECLCEIQENLQYRDEIGKALSGVCVELLKREPKTYSNVKLFKTPPEMEKTEKEHIKSVFDYSDCDILCKYAEELRPDDKRICLEWLTDIAVDKEKRAYVGIYISRSDAAIHDICQFIVNESNKENKTEDDMRVMLLAVGSLGDIMKKTDVLRGTKKSIECVLNNDEYADYEALMPPYNIYGALKAVSEGNYDNQPNEDYLLTHEYDHALLTFAEQTGMKEECADWLITFNKKIGENDEDTSRYPEHPLAEATRTLLTPHIEKRKEEIKARLHKQGGADTKSLVEMCDKVGVIKPDKSKTLSPIIKEAILEKRKHQK